MSDEQLPIISTCPTCDGSGSVTERMIKPNDHHLVVLARDALREQNEELLTRRRRDRWRRFRKFATAGALGTGLAFGIPPAAESLTHYWEGEDAAAALEAEAAGVREELDNKARSAKRSEMRVAQEARDDAYELRNQAKTDAVTQCFDKQGAQRCVCIEQVTVPEWMQKDPRTNLAKCYRDTALLRLGGHQAPAPKALPSE